MSRDIIKTISIHIDIAAQLGTNTTSDTSTVYVVANTIYPIEPH